MKSCLGMLFAILILLGVIASVVGIWYLSDTSEFSRRNAKDPVSTKDLER